MAPRQIWIVDDEPTICWALSKALESEGYCVNVFSTAESFLTALSNNPRSSPDSPDVIFLDVRLPGVSGLETLNRLQQMQSEIPVILMTAFGDLKIAVDAVKHKAFDYLTKPFALNTALNAAERALRKQVKSEVVAVDEAYSPVDAFLGRATVMQEVYKQIALAANNDWPVLITGEQGVGKSIIARLIHQHSERSAEPLLTQRPNPDDPLECLSELFGFETNQDQQSDSQRTSRPTDYYGRSSRAGLLTLARRGSIVIEELTLLPLSVQMRLFEALESNVFVPLSSSRQEELTARLIFNTCSRLDASLADGELYPQLMEHLQIHTIHVPTLAEHREDIPLLVRAALQQPVFGSSMTVTDEAMEELKGRRWQGNLRELNQTLQRAAVKSGGTIIDIDDLPPPLLPVDSDQGQDEVHRDLDRAARRWILKRLANLENAGQQGSDNVGFLYEQCLEVIERALIETVLENTHGNRASAAELLGLHRTTLRQKAKRLGID